jgi:hypothetical protein
MPGKDIARCEADWWGARGLLADVLESTPVLGCVGTCGDRPAVAARRSAGKRTLNGNTAASPNIAGMRRHSLFRTGPLFTADYIPQRSMDG